MNDCPTCLRPISTLIPLEGSVLVDLDKRQVTKHGVEILLSAAEYRLISYLAYNNGIILSANRLIDYIWGDSHAETTHALRHLISRVRKKIEPNPATPVVLTTRTGIGYVIHKGVSIPSTFPHS